VSNQKEYFVNYIDVTQSRPINGTRAAMAFFSPEYVNAFLLFENGGESCRKLSWK
jgi:hypothetical protein